MKEKTANLEHGAFKARLSDNQFQRLGEFIERETVIPSIYRKKASD